MAELIEEHCRELDVVFAAIEEGRDGDPVVIAPPPQCQWKGFPWWFGPAPSNAHANQ